MTRPSDHAPRPGMTCFATQAHQRKNTLDAQTEASHHTLLVVAFDGGGVQAPLCLTRVLLKTWGASSDALLTGQPSGVSACSVAPILSRYGGAVFRWRTLLVSSSLSCYLCPPSLVCTSAWFSLICGTTAFSTPAAAVPPPITSPAIELFSGHRTFPLPLALTQLAAQHLFLRNIFAG